MKRNTITNKIKEFYNKYGDEYTIELIQDSDCRDFKNYLKLIAVEYNYDESTFIDETILFEL